MKIVLDGSDLLQKRLDGTSIYVRHLFPLLIEELQRKGYEVVVLTPEKVEQIDPKITKVVYGRRFWTQTSLSRALFKEKADLLFLPIQTVPLYRPRNLKVVATVHDLDFIQYPRMYGLRNNWLLRWFTHVVARNATKIIAVSERTKRAIVNYYQRPEEDIFVVHHGYDKERFRLPAVLEEREEKVKAVLSKYGIPKDVILFVGAIQPRKNIVGLIKAFEILKDKGIKNSLVIVSGNGWKQKSTLREIKNSPYKKDIYILKSVGFEDLTGIYWDASVFVLPSFSEGFGLPVLEALASGVPVATSENSPMKDIAKDAALLFDPQKPESIAEKIQDFLNSELKRESFIKKGLERSREFSWEKAAKETAMVIEKALGKD